jgi:SAM-dependent methyltransferase
MVFSGTGFKDVEKKISNDFGYFTGIYRSDFIYFLPYNKKPMDVLDLGSGFGNITIPLAKRMPNANICAVDASLDILQFLKLRAESEGCKNIEYSKVDVFEKCELPFKEKSFDLIILNGVLEWIGSGTKEGNPRDIQKKFLSYLKTLIKDEGSIYVGIEGRYFVGYFTGIMDPHSRIRFTSVVPRSVADLLCRIKGKIEGYRTFTYSRLGYEKLFQESGLFMQETFYPVASYKDPYFVISDRNKKAYNYIFESWRNKIYPAIRGRLVYKILMMLGVEKHFAPSYLFLIGNNKKNEKYLVEHYAKDVIKNSSDYEYIKVIGNLSNNGFINFVLFSKTNGSPEYVMKIKRTNENTEKIRDNFNRLARFGTDNFILPSAYTDIVYLYPYFVLEDIGRNNQAIIDAISFIKTIHKTDNNRREDVILPSGIKMHSGFTHGDFNRDNVYKIKGKYKLIDFDEIKWDTPQVFDVCNFVMHWLRIEMKKSAEEAVESIVSNVVEFMKVYESRINSSDTVWIFKKFFESELAKDSNDIRTTKRVYYSECLKLLTK